MYLPNAELLIRLSYCVRTDWNDTVDHHVACHVSSFVHAQHNHKHLRVIAVWKPSDRRGSLIRSRQPLVGRPRIHLHQERSSSRVRGARLHSTLPNLPCAADTIVYWTRIADQPRYRTTRRKKVGLARPGGNDSRRTMRGSVWRKAKRGWSRVRSCAISTRR